MQRKGSLTQNTRNQKRISRILIVDDDPDILALFRVQFENSYETFTAMDRSDVDELLSYAAREGFRFDVLICDQHLSDCDGLDIVKQIKEMSPSTIRMVVSAYRNFDRLLTAINEGEIYRYIVKPWNAEELQQTIDLALKSRELEKKNNQLIIDLRQLAMDLESRNSELVCHNDQLSHFLSVLYDVQRETDLNAKLDLVVRGIVAIRIFQRAIIYLFNETMDVKAFRHCGLSDGDVQRLIKRDPLTKQQRISLLQDKYQIGGSYFIPFQNHGHEVNDDQMIPSQTEENTGGDWHPQDILLIPLYGQKNTLLGLLSVDDPHSGKRPSQEELHLIELFAHEAGLIIEQEEVRNSVINSHRIIESQNMELRGKKLIFNSLLSLNYLTRKSIDIELVIKSFKDYLIALFNADTFHLLLKSEETATFQLFHAHCPPVDESVGGPLDDPKLEPFSISSTEPFIERLLVERRPIFVNVLPQTGSLQQLFQMDAVTSLFSAPLIYNEQVLGIMIIGFQTHRNLSLKLLEDYELFSSQLAGIFFQKSIIRKQERTQRQRYLSTIQALAKAIEKKDPYTKDHCDKVRGYAVNMARKCCLSVERTNHLEVASILHDIGKIGISMNILRKETPLSIDEYEMIKKHPEIGEEILHSLPDFEAIRSIIRHHQECYDGSGYPDGLAGCEIPVEARILSIADAYDAMTSDRPYRKALSREDAIEELKQKAGAQWDPHFVTLFLEMLHEEQGDTHEHIASEAINQRCYLSE